MLETFSMGNFEISCGKYPSNCIVGFFREGSIEIGTQKQLFAGIVRKNVKKKVISTTSLNLMFRKLESRILCGSVAFYIQESRETHCLKKGVKKKHALNLL